MRTTDGRYRILAVRYEEHSRYRVEYMPGRYWMGDYRTIEELIAALSGYELADLVPEE